MLTRIVCSDDIEANKISQLRDGCNHSAVSVSCLSLCELSDVTYRVPTMKTPSKPSFSPRLIFRRLNTSSGRQSVVMSASMLVARRDKYIQVQFIVHTASLPSQFAEIGQAWSRVARKNAMVHKVTKIRVAETAYAKSLV